MVTLPKRVEILVTLDVSCTDIWNERDFSLSKTQSDPELPGGYIAAFSSGADKVVIGDLVYRKIDDVAINPVTRYDDDDQQRLASSGHAKRKLVYEFVESSA